MSRQDDRRALPLDLSQRDQGIVAQVVFFRLPEDLEQVSQLFHMTGRPSGMQLHRLFGIGGGDKAGRYVGQRIAFFNHRDVFAVRIPFPDSDINGERLAPLHPRFLKGTVFDHGIAGKFDVGSIREEKLSFNEAERSDAERRFLDLQILNAPKMGSHPFPERRQLGVPSKILLLKMLRLKKQALVPKERLRSFHE
jgi:hypothetical protein